MKKLFIFILSLGLPYFAFSQEQFMITPTMIETTTLRGGVKVFSLQAHNTYTKQKIRCRFYSQDLKMLKDGNLEFLPKGTMPHSCAEWINLSLDEAEIKPGSSKEIAAKLSVPASTSPGGYYAAIIAEIIDDTKVRKSQVKIRWRLACLVKLTVSGGRLEKKAEVEDLIFLYPEETDKQQELNFVASVKNIGNIHIKTKGKLVIKSPDRKRKGQVDFEMGTGTILPGATRNFEAVYSYFLPAGDYIAESRFNFGGYRPAKKEFPFSVKIGGPEEGNEQGIIFLSALSIKPDSLKVESPAGGFRTLGIKVFNRHNQPLHIQISLRPEDNFNREWVEIKPTEFDLKPLGIKNLRGKIVLPKDIENGIYRAQIIFKAGQLNKDMDEDLSNETLDLEIGVPKL